MWQDVRALNATASGLTALVVIACLASMVHWNEAEKQYDLGPPLWIAQEIYDQATSMNPAYELSYWVRGLTIAQAWRERLHLGRAHASKCRMS